MANAAFRMGKIPHGSHNLTKISERATTSPRKIFFPLFVCSSCAQLRKRHYNILTTLHIRLKEACHIRDQESDILQIGIEDQSDEEQCARYWTDLTAEFNLNELDLNQMSHATPGPALNGGECGRIRPSSLKCEAFIAWNGTTLTATHYPDQKWVHPPIIDMIESFANWSGLEPFEFDEHTHDGGACVSSKDRPIVLHSEPPPEWNMETVLWPIYGIMYTQIPKWLQNPPDGADDPWKSKTQCIWRGAATGGAGSQAACNRGRNSCKTKETDRQCLLRLKPGKLDAAFGKAADYWRHNCIVSVDGNTWASSLKPSLVHGKLALRVGGFNASSRTRLSYYEWYEPMLKAGVHYIQTTIDDLEATIEDIDVMDEDELQQIAVRGQQAFLAISNETSLACYGKLELQRVHKKMQKK